MGDKASVYLWVAVQKVKETIPVYEICNLPGRNLQHSDFIAERFGDFLKIHPNLHLPHGHAFYHLLLFTKGGGYHTIDFNSFPVEIGQVYFMVPGQVHSWSFEGETDGYVINFSETFFQSFFKDNQYLDNFSFLSGETKDQVVKLNSYALREASVLMRQIIEEANSEELFHMDFARLQLLQFFILVAREGIREHEFQQYAQPGNAVIQNFRKLLNQNFHQYKLPRDYAAMLFVTPNYLNALCNDLLGKSAGEVIRERILLEAKRQLLNLDESIARIGYNLGFRDNSYFTKFFKKYTGLRPEDFRRELETTPLKT